MPDARRAEHASSPALDPGPSNRHSVAGTEAARDDRGKRGGLDAQSIAHARFGRPDGGLSRSAARDRAEGRGPADIGAALKHEPIFTPVLVWKDCQRIAMCTGCRPVYKCRSCSYQRTCAGGICGWGDVCVWGPYLKVLPRGARIIR